jgi:uncharacterized protein YyaL (SSP411 family)
MSDPSAAPNRLIHETSPYLRQHAQNPVDWYPWGPEALERSRSLNRPIFLSVGYSACHWCHVMEHESFENAEIAQVLNEHFVSIKVDREERPDIDQIYMTAVQLLTGQGGWPMSMFLTPDLRPFYGGTYFPPDDRYNRPGFKRVLLALIDAWKTRQDELLRSAGEITEHLKSAVTTSGEASTLQPDMLRNAGAGLRRVFDNVYGGFGSAPKFPHATELGLLLRMGRRFDDPQPVEMARKTLDHMARGGLYDHLGGGFHRYSTDQRWLVPHFEKMLYDNALLPPAYLAAYQITGEPFYRQVVEETLDYVLREMTSPAGAFYSTQDADSEGVEGKFYVWSAAEIETILGKDLATTFAAVYDVSAEGNWEGHNILNRQRDDEHEARALRRPVAELREQLATAKQKLYEVRSRRIWPGRDDKLLTAWNALMIAAFGQAAAVLDRSDYAAAGEKAADFLLTRMRAPNGRLFRTATVDSPPKLNAYLEDYAFLADALVTLYEATFRTRWLEAALDLTAVILDQFWDADAAGFFFTARDHEALLTRVKDTHDGSVPSGNAMAVTALLRLGRLTGRADLLEKAEAVLRSGAGLMERSPMAASQLLTALDFHLGPVQEFVVVGRAEDADTQRVLRAIRGPYRPNKVVAFRDPSATEARAEELLPLLKDRTSKGPVTTYVCENFVCAAPLIGADAVEELLKR